VKILAPPPEAEDAAPKGKNKRKAKAEAATAE
jgi:hypothetical protein